MGLESAQEQRQQQLGRCYYNSTCQRKGGGERRRRQAAATAISSRSCCCCCCSLRRLVATRIHRQSLWLWQRALMTCRTTTHRVARTPIRRCRLICAILQLAPMLPCCKNSTAGSAAISPPLKHKDPLELKDCPSRLLFQPSFFGALPSRRPFLQPSTISHCVLCNLLPSPHMPYSTPPLSLIAHGQWPSSQARCTRHLSPVVCQLPLCSDRSRPRDVPADVWARLSGTLDRGQESLP